MKTKARIKTLTPFTHEGKTLQRLYIEMSCGHGVVLVQAKPKITRPPACPVCSGEESI